MEHLHTSVCVVFFISHSPCHQTYFKSLTLCSLVCFGNTRLSELKLNGNRFSGDIPSFVGELQNMGKN